jgi:acetylornithine aminotransferase
LCCAAAIAVLTSLRDDNVMQRASIVREVLLTALHQTIAQPDLITEVRGSGLMIGIQPSVATKEIVQRGLDRGLLINVAGGDTIRVLPPLVMTDEQAGELGAGIANIINDIAEQENAL